MIDNILNLKFYKGEDLYSDGDIEDELLEIVQNNEDYTDILKKDNRWAILYHLSKIRHNLLEWYEYNPEGTVLEIGAGCGAVTGVLCEKTKRVVGIELSKRRATINATRNGKYGNLEIMVGNFQDIQLEEKFDYVTLIGVLEYSPLYINSKTPFEDMVLKAKEYLKEGGKLIIAIENKMGLKYLAGVPEDHTGKVFDGVNDYVGVSHVKTLTKNELQTLLSNAGYKEQEWYYPMPDYKMPTVVYSDEHLPVPGELRNVVNVFDRERYQTFNEETVYDQLCKDGKFDYFANSYLIFATK